jgi:hypothetical protein
MERGKAYIREQFFLTVSIIKIGKFLTGNNRGNTGFFHEIVRKITEKRVSGSTEGGF